MKSPNSSLEQVLDAKDFTVGLLLAILLQPVGYTSPGAQYLADQVQTPGEGQTSRPLGSVNLTLPALKCKGRCRLPGFQSIV